MFPALVPIYCHNLHNTYFENLPWTHNRQFLFLGISDYYQAVSQQKSIVSKEHHMRVKSLNYLFAKESNPKQEIHGIRIDNEYIAQSRKMENEFNNYLC